MVQRADGALDREYAIVEQQVPACIIVERVLEEDPRYKTRRPLSLEVRPLMSEQTLGTLPRLTLDAALFRAHPPPRPFPQDEVPLDASVIYLGTPGYGRMATVTAHRLKTRTVDIRLEPANELPQLGQQVLASVPGESYCSGNEAARRVGLPASVFSRLTGLLHINVERPGRGDGKGRTDRVNVGVGIKMHSKMLKVC